MLNDADMKQLERPFLLEEHGFRDGANNNPDAGKPYILREALLHRLSEIDKAWKVSVNLKDITVIGDTVAISGSLTIKGVTRENVATGIVQRLKSDGTEVSPYVLAQNMDRAIKSASSGIIQRCLQAFGCGLYLKSQAFKGINTRDALRIALDKLNNPPHWALNGGGQRIDAKRKTLNLEWAEILANLEPDKALTGLSQTLLTESQASARLDEIALAKLVPPKQTTSRNEEEAFEVRGSELQVDDLIFIPGKPVRRVMCVLGEAVNRNLLEMVLWSTMDHINVVRQSIEKDMFFSVKRFSTLKAAPDTVLKQVDQLKRSYEQSAERV